jgi:hypothetical protein
MPITVLLNDKLKDDFTKNVALICLEQIDFCTQYNGFKVKEIGYY